jgi:predicted permease
VQQHVARLALPADRERKIVEEWAAQLEDLYDGLRADGLSDEEAWRELQHQVPDWHALGGELLDAEPLLLRMASADRGPLASRTGHAVVTAIRETLTTGFVRDLHSGLRLLVKNRGFSAAIILTLAICLGANAAVFTVVHAVLLRPLPVPEPDRIVGIGDVYPTITPHDILSNDVPSYFDRLDAVTALEEQALFTYWFDTINIDGLPEELRGMRATPSLFRVLRVPPALGRTFTDEEGQPGADHKVILSDGLWHRLYGGDPAVVGQTLRLGWTGQRYTIVGVMPRGFSFFDQGYDGHARTSGREAQFWIPLAFTSAQKSDSARTRYGFFHIGRLGPGATIDQVQAQIDALHATNVKRFPQFRFAELGMYTAVTPLQAALTGGIRRTLYLLWGGAGCVLLIGALNIANLSLARASTRARELATRIALGADRFQLTRQLIVEALVPAAIGGVAGVTLGGGILRALAFSGLDDLPNAAQIRIDATVIGLIAAASAFVGLLIGLVPAMTTRGDTINHALGDGSRTATGGRATRLVRHGLVVSQVALSVVLLIAATLLFTSFRHLLEIDAGFSRERVTTATIFPPPSRYPDSQAVVGLSTRLLDRVRMIPGVEAAGITSNIALSGFASPMAVSATRTSEGGEAAVVPSVVAVTAGYFEAMGTPLVRGRYFADSDRDDTLPVAIVDDHLATRLWSGEDPIGKTLYRGDSGPFTVVGVVREVRFESLAAKTGSIGTVYFPHTQAPPLRRLRWIAAKTAGDPAALMRAVRAALAEIDPDLPLSDIQTMSERTTRSLVSQTLAMTLASMFALVALFLSLLGIYGVLANVVARRTREFGIRMALGSTARGVFRLVLREGTVLIGAGLIVGLAGAFAMGRALEGHVFGVQPTDPFILGGVAVATGCVALLACLAPARRATRVDPVDVLSDHGT